MVITVQKPMSLDEAFANLDEVLAEAVHEYEYGLLCDKYAFLQENGVIMEAEQENQTSKNKLLQIVGKIVNAVKRAYEFVKTKIKGLIDKIKVKCSGKKKEESVDLLLEILEDSNKRLEEMIDADRKLRERIQNFDDTTENNSETGKMLIAELEEIAKKLEDKAKKNSEKADQIANRVLEANELKDAANKIQDAHKPL